jgi:parvulin-like peptidyl-prolyl isomerase
MSDKNQDLAKHINALTQENQNLRDVLQVADAEKLGARQMIDEIVSANVRLRAGTILLESQKLQAQQAASLAQTQVQTMATEIANRDKLISDLKKQVEIYAATIKTHAQQKLDQADAA